MDNTIVKIVFGISHTQIIPDSDLLYLFFKISRQMHFTWDISEHILGINFQKLGLPWLYYGYPILTPQIHSSPQLALPPSFRAFSLVLVLVACQHLA